MLKVESCFKFSLRTGTILILIITFLEGVYIGVDLHVGPAIVICIISVVGLIGVFAKIPWLLIPFLAGMLLGIAQIVILILLVASTAGPIIASYHNFYNGAQKRNSHEDNSWFNEVMNFVTRIDVAELFFAVFLMMNSYFFAVVWSYYEELGEKELPLFERDRRRDKQEKDSA